MSLYGYFYQGSGGGDSDSRASLGASDRIGDGDDTGYGPTSEMRNGSHHLPDPTERTGLLSGDGNGTLYPDKPGRDGSTGRCGSGLCGCGTSTGPSAQDFYFPPSNPSIQRYYRFTVTPLAPMAALHRRPVSNVDDDSEDGDEKEDIGNNHGEGGPPRLRRLSASAAAAAAAAVTGILRRSAVVPSHGTDASGNWVLVSVGGRSGWARRQQGSQTFQADRFPSDPAPPTGGFTLARTFHAREAWMGNHSFFCGGRVMLGSDAPSLFFTNGLLVVALGLYFVWASALLSVLTFVTLWIAAMTDPGILPAHSSPHKPAPPQGAPLGGPLGYRYCSTCNIFRPPRSKHCNACNVCVDAFDHHCPWIGNCVAARNYRFFCVFLLAVAAVAILATLAAVQLLLLAYQDVVAHELLPGIGPVMLPPEANLTSLGVRGGGKHRGGDGNTPTLQDFAAYGQHTTHVLWHTLLSQPVTVLFGVFTFLCAWSLVSLLAYHALIISVAQTTNERVRGVYRYSGSAANAADRGVCRNWWAALCGPRPPSRLPRDFSELVVCDEAAPEQPWAGDEPIGMAPDARQSSAELDAEG